MPQVPAKTGSGHRFSDIFAARTLDVTQETGVAMDDLGAMALGLQPTAAVQAAASGGSVLPFGVVHTSHMASPGVAQNALTDSKLTSEFAAADLAPVASLAEREANSRFARPESAQPLPTAQGAELALDADLTPVATALKPSSTLDTVKAPLNLARVTATPTEQGADEVVSADAFNADSLAEAEVDGFERLPLTQRVAVGTEGVAVAAMAPRSAGVLPADARQTAPRSASASVGRVADASPDVSVENAVSELTADFDAVADEGLSMPPIRQQAVASTVSVAPDMLNAVNPTFDTTTRSATPVEDTAALESLDGAPDTVELSIDTPVEDANWSEALNYRLQWLAQKDGVQSARIQLNPVELGPLEVNIELVDDVASIQIRADHGVTRDALEQAAPRLREMMAGAGFERAELDLTQGQQGERETSERGLSDRQGNERAANTGLGASSEDAESAQADSSSGPDRIPGADPGSGGSLNLYV